MKVKKKTEIDGRAPRVGRLASEADNLGVIPHTHMVEGENRFP